MKALAALPLLAIPSGAPPAVFEPLGVCAVDDSGARCWDFQGAPLPALTAEVDQKARQMMGTLNFILNRKNRYVVVRQRPVRQTALSSGSGQIVSYPFVVGGVADLTALRVAALPNATTETIVAKIGAEEGEGKEMPLREGARTYVDGIAVELGRPAPAESPGRFYGRFWGGPFWGRQGGWQFPYGLTPAASIALQAIGRDGKPILFVDQDGKPVERTRGEALVKEAYGPIRDWSRRPPVDYAYLNTSQGTSSLASCDTNIDPKAIAKLRVRRVVEHTETIGPFALDPR